MTSPSLDTFIAGDIVTVSFKKRNIVHTLASVTIVAISNMWGRDVLFVLDNAGDFYKLKSESLVSIANTA